MFKTIGLFVIICVLCAGTYVLAADPVGQWKFDEASGTTAYDSSAGAHNGTVNGGATLNGSGLLTLDGTDDYVSLPIGSVISSLNSCTIAAWINLPASVGNWKRVFDFGSSTTINMFLTPKTDSGVMRFAITTSGGGGEQQLTAAVTPSSGAHIIIVRIDSVADRGTLFLDGTIVATNNSMTLAPSNLGSTTNNWLGRSEYSGDGYFNCSYDEFRIYNYAMSDTEIAILSQRTKASNPGPADGASVLCGNIELGWQAGIKAVSHDIYFGTDFTAINNATPESHTGVTYASVDVNSYDPGGLNCRKTYYWRIDEVNDPNIWKGDVWSFTMYTNTFEDFESYANSGELTAVWLPAGAGTADLATDTAHSGVQSMALTYFNGNSPYYTSVNSVLSPIQDFRANNIRSISLYFRGYADNTLENMYMIFEDADWGTEKTVIKYDGDPNNLKSEAWSRWDIDIQQLVDANPVFRLGKISKITIALGNPENPQPGSSGVIYIDDIALRLMRCVEKNEPLADLNGDCVVDINDIKLLALYWLSGESKADAYQDKFVDLKDEAVVANKWLQQVPQWPKLVDSDKFLTAVPFYDVNVIGGLWGKRIATVRDVTIAHCWNKNETTTGRLSNFYNAINHTGSHQGYVFNDTDIYKTLEATAYSLRLFPDANLEAYADNIINIIGQVQWSGYNNPAIDGYLNTTYSIPNPQPTSIWKENSSNNHETYCAGHFIESAIAYYQTTGKVKVLDIAKKFANNMCANFGPGKLMNPPGHQEVELALMKLYWLTGDVNYFNLTKFFIDQRGNAAGHSLYGTYAQDDKPLVDQTTGVGHAVRASYFYSGVADVARVNEDQAYMNALLRVWDNIVSCKTYITGGLGQPGGPEGFTVDYDLGNNSYCETCASIAFANWNYRMFLLTGDGRYVDMMERSMLNNVLSGISLQGNTFFYPNALNTSGATRPDWYDCACCPPNEARFIMSIGEKAYAIKGNNIYVSCYMNGTAAINTPGNTVNLVVDTNYPWFGNVSIIVNPQHSGEFAVYLRIPGWAQGRTSAGNLYKYLDQPFNPPELQVNGIPLDVVVEKGFTCIKRTWQAGDVIELSLPMPVRRTVTHPSVAADAGLVELERGPIVYCAEFADANGGKINHLVIQDDANLTSQFKTNLLNSPTIITEGSVLTGTVKGAYTLPGGGYELRDELFTAIPYYAWAHRGSGAMKVWMPRDPNKATPISPPQPPVYEMYGWWKFDETSGTTAADSSGKGNNGTLVNGPVWVAGHINNGLQFDGTNDYVDLPDGFSNFQAGLTINVWAYPTAAKNYARFVDLGNGSSSDNIILGRVSTGTNLFAEVWLGGTRAGSRITATGAIALNTWQMFTMTVDASGNTILYKNGVVVGSGTTGVPNNVTRVNNYIGKSNWSDAYYQGIMDEVRIYSYPLTQTQIQTIYNGG